MGLLDDRRAREHARRLARTWAAHAAGESGLPTPLTPARQGGSSQPIILAGQRQDPGGIATALGETVTLSATVTAAGWIETWDTVLYREGFGAGVAPPRQSVPGYYNAYATISLDEPVADLEVRAQAGSGREVVDVAPFASAWRGSLAMDDEPAGASLRLYVDPKGATATVTCTFHLVEPIGLQPVQPGPSLIVSGQAKRNGNPQSNLLQVAFPTGTYNEGDLLVLAYSGFIYMFASGADGTVTPPSEFTEVFKFTPNDRIMHWVGWKIADADDVAKTAVYEFTVSGSAATHHDQCVLSVVPGYSGVDGVDSSGGLASLQAAPRVANSTGPAMFVGMSTYHQAGGLTTEPSNVEAVGQVTGVTLFSGTDRPAGRIYIGSMVGGASAGIDWTDASSPDAHAVSAVAVMLEGGVT